jgi:hypothetical protein
MALNVEMVTFDCSDPAKLADWWAEQFEGRDWVSRRLTTPHPARTGYTWISAPPTSTPR